MATFAESLRDAARTGLCNYLGDVEKGRRYVNRVSVVPAGDFLRPLRNNLCDDNAPAPDPLPFDGGQCSGVSYTVNLFPAGGSSGPQIGSTGAATGPVISVTFDQPDQGKTLQSRVVTVVHNGGNSTYQDSVNLFETFPNDNAAAPWRAVVTRVDGMPDDCGNPGPIPPEPFPTGGDTYPITFTYTNNEGDEITEEGDIRLFAPVFVPIIGSFNTLVAPIRVELPDLVFDGTIELAPNFNFNITPGGSDRSPGNPTNPDGPVQPDTDEDTDDDEINEQLAGVFVRSQFSASPQATQLFGNATPDLFVPRLASLFFRVREGGRLGWLGPIDVKTTNAYVPVPVDVFAIRANIFPEEGVESALTPIRKRVVDDLT